MKFKNFKILLSLITFICITTVVVKSTTLEWVDQTGAYTFTDKEGWNPPEIPQAQDDTFIKNGATVKESVNNVTVNSINISNDSELSFSNMITISNTISMDKAKSQFGIYLYTNKIDSLDSQLIAPTTSAIISSFNSNTKSYLNFNGNSQFIAPYSGCTSCQVLFLINTIAIFNDNSSLNFKGIEIYTPNDIIFNDQSSFIVDETPVFIEGNVIFNDKSYFIIKNISDHFFQMDWIILNQQSNLSLIDNALLPIRSLELYDNSYVYASNTILSFLYNITMHNQTSMFLDNQSLLFSSDGMTSRVRNVQLSNLSDLGSRGDFYCEGDYLNLTSNSFIESYFGDLHLNSTLTSINQGSYAKTYNGNIHVYKTLEGNNANFFINGGNFIVHPNSNTTLKQSDILIMGGKLYISSDAIFSLEKTSVRNKNGTLSTSGIVYVTPDSKIENDKDFIIQSSIISTDKSSNILFTNTGIINLNGTNNNNGGSGSGNNNINKSNINNDIDDDESSDIESNYIKIEAELQNTGIIKVEKNQRVHINKYSQSNENSVLVFDNSTINSNETLTLNNGKIYGNGTFGNSLNQNSGEFGSRNETISIDINGDYTLNSTGIILIKISSHQDFSKINILNNANLNGSIEIMVSKDLINNKENKQLDIINYSSLNSNDVSRISKSNSGSSESINAFQSIKFKTYDPVTGKEEDQSENDCLKSSTSDSSFSVLVGGCNSKKSLSGGAIAGIVIGCAAATAILVTVIHYRSRILLKLKLHKLASH